jgi:hypothetical protein
MLVVPYFFNLFQVADLLLFLLDSCFGIDDEHLLLIFVFFELLLQFIYDACSLEELSLERDFYLGQLLYLHRFAVHFLLQFEGAHFSLFFENVQLFLILPDFVLIFDFRVLVHLMKSFFVALDFSRHNLIAVNEFIIDILSFP